MSFATRCLLCDFQKFPGTALVYDLRRARIAALLCPAIASNLLLQFVNDFCGRKIKTDPYHWSINFEKWDWMKRVDLKRITVLCLTALLFLAANVPVYAQESSGMELTAEERAYVEQKKALRVVLPGEWRPVVALEADQAGHQGLAVDILRYLEAEVGLRMEFVKASGYEEAICLVEEGAADVVAMAVNYQNEAPAGPLTVTGPYLKSELMMLHNKDVSLGDQDDLTIAQVKGYPAISDRASISYMDFTTLDECLLAVRTGQADAVYCNVFTGLDAMRRFENRELTAVPLNVEVQFRFGIGPGEDAMLKTLLDHAIASVPRSDINASLTYGGTSAKSTLGDFVYYYPFEIICAILSVFFLCVLIMVWYIRVRGRRAVSLHGYETSYRMLADAVGGIGLGYNCMEDTLSLFGKEAGQLAMPAEIKNFSEYLQRLDKGMLLTPELLEQMLIEGMMTGEYETELKCQMSDGQWRHFRFVFSVLSTDEAYQRPVSLVGYLTNIEGEHQEREALRKLSQSDKTTGLYNRAGAEAAIQKHLQGESGSKNDILLVIDVDCFKEFNDRYGHDCGDSVLAYMGQNLRGIFRRDDILCRWGGDEFLLYLFDAASHKEQIEERCRRLRDAMKEYQYEGRTLSVTLSIGGAVVAERSLAETFKLADQALYTVKGRGRDSMYILPE